MNNVFLALAWYLYFLYFFTRFCKPKSLRTFIYFTTATTIIYVCLSINKLSLIALSYLLSASFFTSYFLCIGKWKKKLMIMIACLIILLTSCFFAMILLRPFIQLNTLTETWLSSLLFASVTTLFNYMSGRWLIYFKYRNRQHKNSLYIAYPLCMLLLVAMYIGTSFLESILSFLYFLLIIAALLSLILLNDKLVDNKIYKKEKEVERLRENEAYLQSKYDWC